MKILESKKKIKQKINKAKSNRFKKKVQYKINKFKLNKKIKQNQI